MNDLNALKKKEIQDLEVERIRKKSEKIQLESKRAKQQQQPNNLNAKKSNDGQTNRTPESDDSQYFNLSECVSRRASFKDFTIVKLVGKGSFGKVFLVTTKSNASYYAMKALKKDVVLQDDDVECTMLERDVCKLGNKNPYITRLYCTFQNEVSCFTFFLIEIMKNQDFFDWIHHENPKAKFQIRHHLSRF